MITNIKQSESQASMSCDNGVPESTIHVWLKDEEKLHDFLYMVNSADHMKINKVRTAKDPQLD